MSQRNGRFSGLDDTFDNSLDALPLRPIHPPNLASSSYVPLLSQEEGLSPSRPWESAHRGPEPSPSLHQTSSTRPRQARSLYAPLPDDDVLEGTSQSSQHANPSAEDATKFRKQAWKPFSLRWPALVSSCIAALVLGLVVVFLLVYSVLHDGLGDDYGSSAILFGWRFTPTLITVLYNIPITIMFNDARRTESFVRMSHVSGASSASGLFKPPGQWWKVFADSFKKRENHGHFSYFLLATVLVNVISFLFINPLSSALLQSQPVEMISKGPFTRYAVSDAQPIRMAANDLVYFRTIGNVLQNLTTSAWLTDKYAVVPFSPSTFPLNVGITTTGKTQQWQTNTSVLSVDLDCEVMNFRKAFYAENSTEDGAENSKQYHSLLLTDSQGCEAGIKGYDSSMVYYGGGSWFTPPQVVLPVWDDSYSDEYFNATPQCNDRQVMLSTNGSWIGERSGTWNNGFKAAAWSCNTIFYSAVMSVKATTGPSETTLDIDEDAFNALRSRLSPDVLDLSRFESAFLDRNWTNMIYTPDEGALPNFGGVSALLAAAYNFDAVSMINSDSVGETARRIKQRFLGEMMIATIAQNTPIAQTGEVFEKPRRVIVNLPIAISLAALFFISAALIAAVLFLSNRRPLNLHHDPASVAAVVKLIEGNSVIRDCFKARDEGVVAQPSRTFDNTTHFLRDGLLLSIKRIDESPGK